MCNALQRKPIQLSVDKINKIDFISTTPDGSTMRTISDHLLWDMENDHLLLLRDQINSYLRFIESGEIFGSYPAAKDTKIIFRVVFKYKPNKDSITFLGRAKDIVINAGIDFDWKTF